MQFVLYKLVFLIEMPVALVNHLMQFCLNHSANEIDSSTDVFVDLLAKVQKFLSQKRANWSIYSRKKNSKFKNNLQSWLSQKQSYRFNHRWELYCCVLIAPFFQFSTDRERFLEIDENKSRKISSSYNTLKAANKTKRKFNKKTPYKSF